MKLKPEEIALFGLASGGHSPAQLEITIIEIET